jgi:hypothetical protein
VFRKQTADLVRHHAPQVLGLLDPVADLGLGGYLANELLGLVDLYDFLIEVLGVSPPCPLCQTVQMSGDARRAPISSFCMLASLTEAS